MLQKRREIKNLLLFMTLLLLFFSSQTFISFNSMGQQSMRESETLAGHIVHSVIVINGDAAFDSQAASESWPGSGTLGDPYRIENYLIDASTGNGIDISNTGVHFVIYNCTIFGVTSTYRGIRLDNVSNATITENELIDNVIGIHLYNSDSNMIEDNEISHCKKGIVVDRSDYVTIHNNTCSDSTDYDLVVGSYCNENIITNNTCMTSGEPNIRIAESPNATLSYNRMHGLGLVVEGNTKLMVGFVEFTDNTVNDTPILYLQDEIGGDYTGDYAQVILAHCDNVLVRDMILTDTQKGVIILFCNNTVIKNVSCIGCYYGIQIIGGHHVTVTDCNVSYSGYTGLGIGWAYDDEQFYNHLITNSTFSYSGERAMTIGGEGGTTIFNNTCHDNSQRATGIDQIFVMSTHNITIANNTCWDASPGSANIFCAAVDSLIANNTCIDSEGHGIELDGADRSVVINNYCRNNSWGMKIIDTSYTYIADNFCN